MLQLFHVSVDGLLADRISFSLGLLPSLHDHGTPTAICHRVEGHLEVPCDRYLSISITELRLGWEANWMEEVGEARLAC